MKLTRGSLIAAVGVAAVIALYVGRDARGTSARVSADGWYYHVYLVSLVGDRDLDFTDEYAVTGNWYRFGAGPTGRPVNPFGIGPAIFEAPFYALGGAVAAIAGHDTAGFDRLHMTLTMLAAPLFSVAALFFVIRLLRRRLGTERHAVIAALAAFLGGPMVYYAVRQPGYAHPFAFFFVAWLVDAWDASYDRPRTLRTWLALGALLGAAALARPQLALWGVLLAAAVVDDVRRGVRNPLRWLAGAAAALVVFAPQLVAWKSLYGAWWVLPQGPGFMVWDAPAWSEVLFSSRNGLFAWAPLLAVSGFGLILSVMRTPRLAGLLFCGFLLQVIANGAVWDWWAGGSFGGRRFDSCIPAFAYGLGYLLVASPRVARVLVGAVTAVCVAGNLWLAAVSNVFSLPEHGKQPAAAQLVRKLPPGLGHAVAALSWTVTVPARAAFALRHGVPLGAYDRVVGWFWTTEQYPGTGGGPKPVDKRKLTGDEPFLVGFEPSPGGARLIGERGVLLIGLNRRHGPVHATLAASAPARLSWNGRPAGETPSVALDPVDRGVHRLEVEAPAGTGFGELTLEVSPGTPP